MSALRAGPHLDFLAPGEQLTSIAEDEPPGPRPLVEILAAEEHQLAVAAGTASRLILVLRGNVLDDLLRLFVLRQGSSDSTARSSCPYLALASRVRVRFSAFRGVNVRHPKLTS